MLAMKKEKKEEKDMLQVENLASSLSSEDIHSG